LEKELREISDGKVDNHQSRLRREDLYNSVLRLAYDCDTMDKDLQWVESQSTNKKQSIMDDELNVASVIQVINVQDTSLHAIYMTVDELRRYIDEIQLELRHR
jgi:hypothetical protein